MESTNTNFASLQRHVCTKIFEQTDSRIWMMMMMTTILVMMMKMATYCSINGVLLCQVFKLWLLLKLWENGTLLPEIWKINSLLTISTYRLIDQLCKIINRGKILLVQTASDTFWATKGEAAARTEKCRAPDLYIIGAVCMSVCHIFAYFIFSLF